MNDSLWHLGPEGKGAGSPRGPRIELNNILAPIDFSPASRRGLVVAAGLATHFRSQLDVIYVVEPPSMPQWGYAHLPIREAKLRRAAEEQLPQFVVESGIAPTLVRSTTVRCGGADLEICEAAVEKKADLIVLASHGLGGVKHALVGSTAERVVRHAPCPVLTLRDRGFDADKSEQCSFAPKRLLVTTDFSKESKKAFQYAEALAHKFQATLALVHVVPDQLRLQFGYTSIPFDEQEMLSAAREQLPRFREAELDPHVHVESLVLHGGAAHEICAAANTQHADLIVISTHGYTGLNRFTLGSVTENVVRHAPCAVLVVR